MTTENLKPRLQPSKHDGDDALMRISSLEATIEREHQGMLLWKRTAEQKDLDIIELHKQLAEARKGARMFPMQNPPIPIEWATAEIIYAGYAAMYGRQQSLERMAERGGFGWGEVRIIYQNTKGRNAIDAAIKENRHD